MNNPQSETARTQALHHSMIALCLTIVTATFVHFATMGFPALIVGIVLAVLIIALGFGYQHTKNQLMLIFYAVFSLLPILGFGVFNGFWNHLVKIGLVYLHNGQLPPLLAGLFLTPILESWPVEIAGILTFVLGVTSGVLTYRLVASQKQN